MQLFLDSVGQRHLRKYLAQLGVAESEGKICQVPVQKETQYVRMPLLGGDSQGGVVLVISGLYVGSRSHEALYEL